MKKSKIITVLLSFLLILSACQMPEDTETDNTTDDTTNEVQDETDEQKEESSTPDEDNSSDKSEETEGIENHEFDLSLEDAVDIFQDNYGKMEVYAVELTTEEQVYQYEIKGHKNNTEYKVHVHADNGDILDEKEEDDDDDEHIAIDFDKIITPKEAMDKTIDEFDAKVFVTSWELGEEDGDMAYEVEYVFKEEGKEDGDITINAYSGDILEN